ncbi:hypothetical protein FD04_GL000995 [Secundilactobacillus odoratitofui DSM 19909 = JCM 15043]|uniref:VWA-like domain-containing protein n=1 Tax=Secundilactobacillus odoratitofui DSM 19909 = JCM 15043 TaxID=1423776 RepID=A0A0R1M0C1_9LACO|nr:VWA-like domain-containing protein [Secundilactobacillus odoratitofui]KRK98018.1 hypothetical protein FD04_GL000995 [Secundilactobacillus odoratitofui DSM 19909 = JCM 15043]
MTTLTQMLIELKQTSNSTSAATTMQRLFQSLAQRLLTSQRFYGELFLRLPKQLDVTQAAAIAIDTKPQLCLNINPQQLAVSIQTDDQLLALVTHVIGHLAWQHPARYESKGNQRLVQVATDIVVNAELPQLFPEAITRQRVNFNLGLHLPAGLSSTEYLSRLAVALKTDKNGETKAKLQRLISSSPESHGGWHGLTDTARNELSTALASAWHQTPRGQRGTVPVQLQRLLNEQPTQLSFDWRQLVMLGLNGPLKRTQPAFNRFNRRQPYRLELPGQTHVTTRQLYVFVDESGSMTDTEVAQLLNQLQQLLKRYQESIIVIPFDATVHTDQRQRIHTGAQLNLNRAAGGGTAYQPIFDWLAEQRLQDQQAVVLILTDGHGESNRINNHGFTNVIWGLITSPAELSVTQPIGKVTTVYL